MSEFERVGGDAPFSAITMATQQLESDMGTGGGGLDLVRLLTEMQKQLRNAQSQNSP